MSEQRLVNTPGYWRDRIAASPKDPRRQLWADSDAEWDKMEDAHRARLGLVVKPGWSILDVGCGYGRLLHLMPDEWHGDYLGIDVSPEFITEARRQHPSRSFMVEDASTLRSLAGQRSFDLAIFIMVRHMITTSLGKPYWEKVVWTVGRFAKRLLVLEPEGYDA